MHKKYLFTALTITALLAGGCAPKNWETETQGAFDPLEGVNRQVYKFNKGVDYVLIKPAAKMYSDFPTLLKTGIENVYNNFSEPANVVNNALQKEGDATVTSTARFTINTVFGVGGLVDVASIWGIERREADFGQTLRGYGMPSTMYFVLPIIGPASFADGIGRGVDGAMYPPAYVDNDAARYSIYAVGGVKTRADLLETTDLLEEIALDEYLFVRDAYEEQRLNNIPTDLWVK